MKKWPGIVQPHCLTHVNLKISLSFFFFFFGICKVNLQVHFWPFFWLLLLQLCSAGLNQGCILDFFLFLMWDYICFDQTPFYPETPLHMKNASHMRKLAYVTHLLPSTACVTTNKTKKVSIILSQHIIRKYICKLFSFQFLLFLGCVLYPELGNSDSLPMLLWF